MHCHGGCTSPDSQALGRESGVETRKLLEEECLRFCGEKMVLKHTDLLMTHLSERVGQVLKHNHHDLPIVTIITVAHSCSFCR